MTTGLARTGKRVFMGLTGLALLVGVYVASTGSAAVTAGPRVACQDDLAPAGAAIASTPIVEQRGRASSASVAD